MGGFEGVSVNKTSSVGLWNYLWFGIVCLYTVFILCDDTYYIFIFFPCCVVLQNTIKL